MGTILADNLIQDYEIASLDMVFVYESLNARGYDIFDPVEDWDAVMDPSDQTLKSCGMCALNCIYIYRMNYN